MNERLASVAGLLLAVVIVVAVMSAPVIGRAIDELRGVPIGGMSRSGARPPPGKSVGEAPVGGGGAATERRGTAPGRGESRGGSSPSLTETGGGAWSGAALVDHGSVQRSSARPDRDADAADEADEANEPPGEPVVPVAPGPRPAALALLRCDAHASTLWLARMDEPALAFDVDEALPGALASALEDRSVRPSALHLVSHGCAPAAIERVRAQLSRLCATDLVGMPVLDLDRGRPLPMCGL